MPPALEVVPLDAARALFLRGQGLLDDPSRPGARGAVLDQIERLGFVQLDSISIVERAHHHILWTRLHSYRPAALHRLQASGRVFEHWTHDASIIPARWFPHWRHRFDRVAWGQWLRRRMGARYRRVLDEVMGRVRDEGPLMARDFEHPGRRGGPWWDWKPAKAALEYWWRKGEFAIARRVRFEKVYDLTERVLPAVHALPAPGVEEHVEWACRTALERLGVATAREIAAFWGLITPAQAGAWCASAAARGETVPVQPAYPARPSYSLADWRRRLDTCPPPPRGLRVLSPFDPLIRDRARCSRLFGFDYRFEAFVPEAKRRYGYYVLPILAGDRLIGRLDPKFDRGSGVLRVRRVWWEPGAGRTHKGGLEAALSRYAMLLGAAAVEVGDAAAT